MVSKVLPVDEIASLINTLNENIFSIKYGLAALHKASSENKNPSMYPDHNHNPFIVGEDEHDFVDEDIVSPLSPTGKKSAWHPDSWSPDRFSRGAEYDNEAHGHSHSPYAAENVEDPSDSVQFNRVDWESQQRNEQELPRSTLSSAEEFRLPRSRDEEDGLGIHITDDAQEVC